jgi:hypothetical protein
LTLAAEKDQRLSESWGSGHMSELIWHLAAGLLITGFCFLGLFAIARDGPDKFVATGSRISRRLKFYLAIVVAGFVAVLGLYLAYLGVQTFGATHY